MTTRVAAFGLSTAAAVVLGAIVCLQLPALPGGWILAMTLCVAAWIWARGAGGRVVGAFVLGGALCGLHATYALSAQLPADMERGDFAVHGRVVGLPICEPQRTAFEFRVAGDDDVPAALRGRLLRLS